METAGSPGALLHEGAVLTTDAIRRKIVRIERVPHVAVEPGPALERRKIINGRGSSRCRAGGYETAELGSTVIRAFERDCERPRITDFFPGTTVDPFRH